MTRSQAFAAFLLGFVLTGCQMRSSPTPHIIGDPPSSDLIDQVTPLDQDSSLPPESSVFLPPHKPTLREDFV